MSDETPETVTPEVTPTTPAVHSDTLWDGPRFIENAGHEPVWIETKQQYWDLLNRRSLGMKHQQESTTGPVRDPMPEIVLPELPWTPPALSMQEAEILHAYEAVLRRYALTETLSCFRCWSADRGSGCRTTVLPHYVRIECRCGIREYRGPVGTSEFTCLPGQSLTENDKTTTRLYDAHGIPAQRATTIFSREEARAIRAYVKFLIAQQLEPTLYCRACWSGRLNDAESLKCLVGHEQIVYACSCRVRFYQGESH